MKKRQKQNSVLVRLVITAMLSAVSFVLYLWEIPIIPGASHLKLDLSNIPVLAGGLVLGTAYVPLIELIKNLLELIARGLGSQMGFGNLMDFISGCAFIIPFCLIYHKLSKKEENKKAVSLTIASVVSTISVVVVGIGANYLIDPPFFKYFLGMALTSDALWPAIWSATALNAIKGVMLSIVSYPIALSIVDRVKKAVRL